MKFDFLPMHFQSQGIGYLRKQQPYDKFRFEVEEIRLKMGKLEEIRVLESSPIWEMVASRLDFYCTEKFIHFHTTPNTLQCRSTCRTARPLDQSGHRTSFSLAPALPSDHFRSSDHCTRWSNEWTGTVSSSIKRSRILDLLEKSWNATMEYASTYQITAWLALFCPMMVLNSDPRAPKWTDYSQTKHVTAIYKTKVKYLFH